MGCRACGCNGSSAEESTHMELDFNKNNNFDMKRNSLNNKSLEVEEMKQATANRQQEERRNGQHRQNNGSITNKPQTPDRTSVQRKSEASVSTHKKADKIVAQIHENLLDKVETFVAEGFGTYKG